MYIYTYTVDAQIIYRGAYRMLIELKSVTKKLGKFKLNPVSFELPGGYIMGLIGPNGAGKTTLIHLLLGLYKADEGEIYAEKTTSSWTTYVKIDYSMPDTTATVTSITTSTGNFFAPWWTATTGYVVTKTASGYEWAAPTGWIQVDSASPIQLTKIWAGTEAQYQALWTYDNTTVYLTV